MSRWPPTEVAEGYNYEAVQENYVITDNTRILRVYYVQPLRHVEGMLMAYLPAERIAFQADLFDTHEPPRPAQLPAMRSLADQVERMELDVDDAGAGARSAGAVADVHVGGRRVVGKEVIGPPERLRHRPCCSARHDQQDRPASAARRRTRQGPRHRQSPRR